VIPRNVRLSEAPSHGKPILLYDARSAGATAYLELATEILHRLPAPRAPIPPPSPAFPHPEAVVDPPKLADASTSTAPPAMTSLEPTPPEPTPVTPSDPDTGEPHGH
jgi:chromosome partitioning protein